MKKCITLILMLSLVLTSVFAQGAMERDRIPVKVLILPKFEIGEITGDFPGEAQYYYDAFVKGGEEYEIKGGFESNPLYVKDGVALYVTGMGKVNSALSLQAVLSDNRFDFSECYFFSTGCAGSATGYSVMGDVFVITSCADFDLGHHADNREMADQSATTWFHDEGYDSSSFKLLDQELTDKVFELVKDTELATTEKTRRVMALTFDNADWAVRDPKVQKGTTVSGDNYWKGVYDEANARLMCETYGAPDPYALTEMEDVALAVVLERYGYLDKYIIVRDSVNMDVFLYGTNPENLWSIDDSLASDESVESADIFATARKNNFLVGSRVVDAILSGSL